MSDTIIAQYAARIIELETKLAEQKEEIERLKFQLEVFVKANDVEYETRFQLEEANSQIESLKAITELAVKGLKEIGTYRKGEALVYVQEIKTYANNTLAEIAKLSHE